MKRFLFYLTFSLIVFSQTDVLYADVFKPCIIVDGKNTTPGTSVGGHPYAYKCVNQGVLLEVKNCGTANIDPSQLDITWYDPTNFQIHSPSVNGATDPGNWVVHVEYTDPVYGTVLQRNDTVTLINYPPPTYSLRITNPANDSTAIYYAHCPEEVMTFHATISSDYLPNRYKWYVSGSGTDTTVALAGTGTTFTTTQSTIKYLILTARTIHGCLAETSRQLSLLAGPPAPNFGADKYKCPGTSVTLSPYSPKQPTYTYNWNGSSIGAVGDTIRTVTAPGKYWVTVTNGLYPCKVSDTVMVYDYALPVITVGGDTSVCYQASGPLHVNGASGNTYSWTPSTYFPGGNTGTTPVIDFNGVALGTYVISVTATDTHGCSASTSENVTHLGQGSNPYLFVTANPIDICQGTTKIFNTTDYATYPTTLYYQWTPSTYLSDATAEKPTVDLTGAALNTPISYSLKVSDTKGCYLTITTSATLVPPVVANVGFTDTSVCLGNSVTLQSSGSGGTGSFTYAWSPATDLDNAALQNPVSTPTVNRTYGVTITDAVGCSDSKTVNVNSIDVQAMLIPTDTFGYNTEPMVLNPIANSNAYKYLWSNITTHTTLDTLKAQTVTETGTYKFIATEPASGCHVSDSINVTIQVGNPRLIYIPNVVNPASSNPENKTVKVYGTAVQENDFAFRIYNKWGEMIYETTSFADANTKGWNGVYKTSNGTEQTLSVYTYSVHGKYFDGQEFNKTGSITLLR